MGVDIKALEARFKEVSLLLYDTSVRPERLEREVMPYIADDVLFVDPWQSEGGRQRYRVGLAGFHAMFRFHLSIRQVNVTLNEAEDGGSALVDGVMHLRQFAPLLTYPLRTILRYDFTLDGDEPRIFFHEEMWSFGDMIEAVPWLGSWYRRVFRPGFSQGFLVASKFAARLRFGPPKR